LPAPPPNQQIKQDAAAKGCAGSKRPDSLAVGDAAKEMVGCPAPVISRTKKLG